MSKSLGSMPRSASRTAPPTTSARKPATRRSRTMASSSGGREGFILSQITRRGSLRGSLGVLVSVEETIEPVTLPAQALDQVFRLAVSGQIVIFARKNNEL